jgi:glucosamine-6-phosphate deaminase
MARAPLRVFPSPEALGDTLAGELLARIEDARMAGRRFLLGSPTGRSPKPVFAAMAQRLATTPRDLSHLVFVMMDEYLVPDGDGLAYASAESPWSCHHFARVEIARRLNDMLTPKYRIRGTSIWFPDPHDPPAYETRIDDAGGIDFFLLASGATDGHVAFNPPGSPRDSRTRIITLSDETRRDNLQTFPAFGTLDAVPRQGISVGIDTIVRSRAAAMIAWGAGKAETVSRMRSAERYDASWPATLIHECPQAEILSDAAAAGTG